MKDAPTAKTFRCKTKSSVGLLLFYEGFEIESVWKYSCTFCIEAVFSARFQFSQQSLSLTLNLGRPSDSGDIFQCFYIKKKPSDKRELRGQLLPCNDLATLSSFLTVYVYRLIYMLSSPPTLAVIYPSTTSVREINYINTC